MQNLSDISQIIGGHSFRGRIKEVRDGSVRVIQVSDINESTGVDYDGLTKTDYDGKKDDVYLREDDILCVSKGPRLYTIVLEDVPDNVVANLHITIVRANSERAIPGYISWFLNNSQAYYQKISQGSGVSHMKKQDLANLPIELPSLENQKIIVEMEKLKRKERHILNELSRKKDVLTLACQKQLSTNQIRRNK